MAFSSWSEFLSMGGHGLYVWAAWGVTALFLLATVWHARLERHQLLKQLRRRARRQPLRPSPSAPVSAKPAQRGIRNDD